MTDRPKRPRRNPRAERAARRAGPRPPIETPAEEPRRQRRDPRAERAARKAPLAEATPAAPAVRRGGTAAPERESGDPPVTIIADPAYLILALPDLENGRLSNHDRDLLGAARGLADAGGGALLAAIFEEPRDDLGVAGIDRVVRFVTEATEGYAPETRTAAVVALAEQQSAKHLLFPDRPAPGGDLGRRVAARLGERAATGVWRIDGNRITRRAHGGSRDLSLEPPRVLLLAEEAAEPQQGIRHKARAMDAVDFVADVRIVDRGVVRADPETVPLAEAEFIISAGNGVSDWQAFHGLAAALGASVGGSRVAVDNGFLTRDRQVGISGTLVTARCYLALGISGAPQHLQGIAKCDRVVVINTDPQCDMVKRADLAVVGDVQAVVPALTRLARKRRRNA